MENCDEIRMEIHSCFVRTHEYWKRNGKNWIARITGLDEKYGYKREFLKTAQLGREKVFLLEDFHIGEIYEIASISRTGGHIGVKDMFLCAGIDETCVVLELILQEDILEKMCNRGENVALQLVHQLLKVVTKDEAVQLIQVHG
ncbi:MAG: hypothetical protein HXS47_06280 [Theionarchaea archaeon]|nr:hypothetical protein [Theionarchaea archaeon]